jgi:hypothetical protein
VSYDNTTTASFVSGGRVLSLSQLGSISRSPGTVALIAKGTTSQVANVLEVQNTAGTNLVSVNPSGNLTATNLTVSGLSTGIAHVGSTGAVTSTGIVDADIASTLSASKITGQAYTVLNRKADTFGPASGIDIYPRLTSTASAPMANGTVHLSFFNATENVTVSNIMAVSPVAGTDSGGTTVRRMGLYTYDTSTNAVTLVARTASDSTMFTSFAQFNRAFSTTGGYPSSYSLVAGTWYAIGFICYNTGGTYNAPSLIGPATQNGLQNMAPYMCGTITGQTDLLTSGTASVGGATTNRWARLT